MRPYNNAQTKIKVWPVVVCCLTTGATHIELAEGYGADPFLQAFSNFASVRGYPSQVYTDKGSQLTRASENIAEQTENWNWTKIEEATSQHRTTWRFAPAASQWRNGMSESRVKAFKEALDILMPAGAHSLSVSEFYTLLKRCCNLINDRPLGVKRANHSLDGEILPITPNMLLLGCSSTQPPDKYVKSDDNNRLTRRMRFIHEVEEQWWSMWFHQIWNDLFPINKWIDKRENLRPGDICLKGPSPSMKKGKYIICRVKETFPDENNLVRTVVIQFRPQDSRETSLPYKSKDLKEEKISVQRLVLICHPQDIQEDELETVCSAQIEYNAENEEVEGEGVEPARPEEHGQQGGEGEGLPAQQEL